MSRSHHPTPLLWLLFLLAVSLPLASRAGDTPSPLHQPWTQCLNTEARRIGINPILFHAIVHTESRANPLAFGWTDQRGHRHSWSAPTQEDATLFLHRLLQTQRNFDSGLAQINVQNVPRLTKQLGIHPLQILDPCTNLTMSAIILEEAIAKHGKTWRAIAAYNGSLDYIPLVWTNLCRVHRYADCPTAGTFTARAHPPAPTDPIRLTRATSIAFPTDDPESFPLSEPPSMPLAQPRTSLHQSRSLASGTSSPSETLDVPALLAKSVVPFCLLIATIVVLSLGIRITLWALRGVRTSYLALKAVRLSAPAYTDSPGLRHPSMSRPRAS